MAANSSPEIALSTCAPDQSDLNLGGLGNVDIFSQCTYGSGNKLVMNVSLSTLKPGNFALVLTDANGKSTERTYEVAQCSSK
jgi:hypothetical protein